MRDNLSLNILYNIPLYGSPIYERTTDDTRVIKSEFPTRVMTLVLHKEMTITPYLVEVCSIEDICIECTPAKDDYKYWEQELFSTAVVMRFIVKSDKKIGL